MVAAIMEIEGGPESFVIVFVTITIVGCKVMIASRKVERLKKATQEIKSTIPLSSSADIDYVQCNIRKEDEVSEVLYPFRLSLLYRDTTGVVPEIHSYITISTVYIFNLIYY